MRVSMGEIRRWTGIKMPIRFLTCVVPEEAERAAVIEKNITGQWFLLSFFSCRQLRFPGTLYTEFFWCQGALRRRQRSP